jgi:hypothetical protein
MDPEIERDDLRRSYRLSGMGFSIYAFSLTVSSVLSVGMLYLIFTGHNPDFGRILGIDNFRFLFGTFRVWTRLASALLLCAAWRQVEWRRRSGFLVILTIVDVLLWAHENGETLGLASGPASHEVLSQCLYMALVWPKFGLIAGLAGDVSDHVGTHHSDKLVKAARGTATTGAVIWFFYFLEHIDWQGGWPLRWRPFTINLLLFELGTMVMSTICLLQTTMLCLRAGRATAQALREMAIEDSGVGQWAEKR